MLGTKDVQKSAAFYDEVLGLLGGKRMMDGEAGIAWGTTMDQPMFGIGKPYDKKEASVGNGTMIALMAESNEQVDKVYAKAIELGAKDEGPAGPRDMPGFYAGYFRDLDGNKLNVFHFSGSLE